MTTTETPTIRLPQRLWLALDDAGCKTTGMALYLGVSENTVRNYLKGPERGGTVPNRGTLIAWATRCEVPVEWLIDGADQGKQASPWTTARVPAAA